MQGCVKGGGDTDSALKLLEGREPTLMYMYNITYTQFKKWCLVCPDSPRTAKREEYRALPETTGGQRGERTGERGGSEQKARPALNPTAQGREKTRASLRHRLPSNRQERHQESQGPEPFRGLKGQV